MALVMGLQARPVPKVYRDKYVALSYHCQEAKKLYSQEV